VLILKEVSFRVKPGQSVALVGVAGSGKSICLQLILRLRDAPLGTVEIDGEDIRNFNCVQLRQQVAYLHNEPLIDDSRTVREVIAYGDNTRQVEIDEIIEAAQKANIHTFISSLPQGYDTMVGTTRLTVGQKRRIFYARLFIKNPRILLIEESCTALDPESERKVVSSFERLRQGRTCLILAHRVRTAETADCILVFHRGRIQERGTHKQLMESGGMYKQIYEAQSGKNQLYESTLVRKFDNQDTPYHYGDFDTISVDNLKRRRSSSLPNLSGTTAHSEPSTGSLNIRQATSFEDFADNIVNNISHGFMGLFSPLARSKRSTNK
jgi:ABC-type multidrug transport system fused ATPase/permease subunit